MERLLQDLRYAWRLLWKRPGFTAVAVASLGIRFDPGQKLEDLRPGMSVDAKVKVR
jgi:hypothetical protein